jgi:stage II sporulation protein AA (anti-sigma F factor antagonist)
MIQIHKIYQIMEGKSLPSGELEKEKQGGRLLHVEMETVRDTLTVRVNGELDLAVSEKLTAMIDKRLKKEGVHTLILDMHGVPFLDSSGLGVILGRYKRITAAGGKMYIVRVRPQVDRLLEVSGVKKLIPVCANEKEILKLQ